MASKKIHKPLSDHKKDTGCGTWFLLHVNAEAAQTPALMSAYASNFRNLCEKMTACGCEDHCRQMLEDLPPEKFFHLLDEDGVPDGCLRHSVECHNRVNTRLGKPTYPYEVVKPLYRSKEPPAPCVKSKEEGKGKQAAQAKQTDKPLPSRVSVQPSPYTSSNASLGSKTSTTYRFHMVPTEY